MPQVFVLARVTLKSLKTLPGVSSLQLPPDAAMVGSNLYSVAESILLAWMTCHFGREFPSRAHRITNFDEDLKSGLVLFSVLAGYWPGVARKKASMQQNISQAQDYDNNAEVGRACNPKP